MSICYSVYATGAVIQVSQSRFLDYFLSFAIVESNPLLRSQRYHCATSPTLEKFRKKIWDQWNRTRDYLVKIATVSQNCEATTVLRLWLSLSLSSTLFFLSLPLET